MKSSVQQLRNWQEITSGFKANLGLSPCGFFLAALGASPGWFSKSPKPGASALRLDSNAEIQAFALHLAGLDARIGWF